MSDLEKTKLEEQDSETVTDEELEKSIDDLIDEYLKDEEVAEADSTDDETGDEQVEKSEEGSEDEETPESIEITAEDLQLLKAAKEQKAKEESAKKEEEFKKSIQSVVQEEIKDLREAVNELTKALRAPKTGRQSVDKVNEVKKSFHTASENEGPKKISKSQVLDTMEELWKAGKISGASLSGYEATSQILDAKDREVVEQAIKELK